MAIESVFCVVCVNVIFALHFCTAVHVTLSLHKPHCAHYMLVPKTKPILLAMAKQLEVGDDVDDVLAG